MEWVYIKDIPIFCLMSNEKKVIPTPEVHYKIIPLLGKEGRYCVVDYDNKVIINADGYGYYNRYTALRHLLRQREVKDKLIIIIRKLKVFKAYYKPAIKYIREKIKEEIGTLEQDATKFEDICNKTETKFGIIVPPLIRKYWYNLGLYENLNKFNLEPLESYEIFEKKLLSKL